MGWHLRVSRFGSTHHVFHQENVNACGTACALMLFQRLRGVKLNSQDVYRGYDAYGNQQFGTRAGAAVGANYDGSAGTWYDDMARYLRNSLGMPCTSYQGSHQECAKSALQTVGDGGVVLASIGWYDTLVKGTFIRNRRVLAHNAVLCSFYCRTSQIVPRPPSTCTAPPHPPLSIARCLPHFLRKNSDVPSTSPSKSHRQARIHRARGSLQTALS